MGKGPRDEIKILDCGCKVGRSKGGLWFYDFLCETHVEDVRENNRYSLRKAEILTEKLNKEMREKQHELHGKNK